ncbi:TonB-dependent receptor domain-containing protein [Arcobacter porcinus]|uniref:TonB-dependent receptor domain-containing protein n=1 Tax=Arcobacter porcinus TaxID=1935204 RepID=UPI00081F423C|nr:TonB-dependent receptor [Arcobacter porcinus]OCL83509.1 Colicin I receptor precursor [Arcobacter porcinus]OCL83728.1 Colicin I receptor precursor [Arcobacter porcinus]
MKIKMAFSVATLLLTQNIVLANETTKLDSVQVVTSASGYEQKVTDAPASISVISQEDLKNKKYANLAEAIEDVEGVDVRGGNGKTGGLNISIRGMGSANTLILIDGRRQNSSGNNTPNGFGETNNNFLPPLSSIERIEVIRGPMSTLYGSDAMGGVINIITKKVADEWTGSIGVDRTFNESSQFGDSNTVNTYISGPLIKDKLGLALRGSHYDRDSSDIKYDDGAEVSKRGNSPVEGKNYSVGAKLNFTPVENHDIYFDIFSSKQKYNNDQAQLGTLNTATVSRGYDKTLRFEKEQYTLGHTSRFNIGTLESSIMRSETEKLGRLIPGDLGVPYVGMPNQVGGEKRELKNTDTVLDTKFVTDLVNRNIITVGGQFWKSEFKDGLVDDKFKQDLWALFLEDEISITDSLALTLGGRYDHHDVFGGNFSPRAYAVFTANDNWTVKGGVSRGFKAPQVQALHDGINGATAQGKQLSIGNPDLKPEKSTNYEAGVYYNADNGFLANATVFFNKYEDKIESGDRIHVNGRSDIPSDSGYRVNGYPNLGDHPDNGSYAQSYNIGKAETKGLEIGTKIPLVTDILDLSANYTYMKTEQKSGDDKGAPFTSTPEHSVNATLNWKVTPKLSTWLKGEYRSDRFRFTEKYENLNAENKAIYDQLGDVNSYALAHLGGSYKWNKDLTFSATIYNLFDKDFFSRDQYTYNGTTKYASSDTVIEGRRLWLAMNLTF